MFIIHGEDEVENIFAQTLTEQGFNACAPYNGEQWAIGAEGAVCLKEGTRIRIEHHVSEGAARAATVFQRLLNAGKRLLRVIEHNEDGCKTDPSSCILTRLGSVLFLCPKEENTVFCALLHKFPTIS